MAEDVTNQSEPEELPESKRSQSSGSFLVWLNWLVAVAAISAGVVAVWQGFMTRAALEITDQALKTQLAATRPYILINSYTKDDDFSLRNENLGQVPARIVFRAQQVFVDGEPQPHMFRGDKTGVSILFQGKPKRTLTGKFHLWGEEALEKLRAGEFELVISQCIIYKSIEGDDPRRWHAWLSVRFDAFANSFAVVVRDEIAVNASTEKCEATYPVG